MTQTKTAEKKEMICIVCPSGCNLKIDCIGEDISVTGNKCKKGKDFAISEITNPMRTICSTVRTVFSECPVLPVRVSKDIPKAKIFDVMKEISKVLIRERIGVKTVIIHNVLDTGADIISTGSLLRER